MAYFYSYDDHYVPNGYYNCTSVTQQSQQERHRQQQLQQRRGGIKKSSDYDSSSDSDGIYGDDDHHYNHNQSKKLRVSDEREELGIKIVQNGERTLDLNNVFTLSTTTTTTTSSASSSNATTRILSNRRNHSSSSSTGAAASSSVNTSVNTSSILESACNSPQPQFITNSLALKRGCDDDLNSTRSSKKSKSIVTLREMKEFFHLLDDEAIKEFLKRDKCCMVSDKYALAMVFTYFKRAKLELNEFTKLNFFLALYLANDIEEDTDEFKYEIFPWALGSHWRSQFQHFLRKRDVLLKNIDYRAIVSRKCCDEVMSLVSDHNAWKRNRPLNHGGATRSYLIRRLDESKENSEFIENGVNLPRGPFNRPRSCPICEINRTNPYL